MICHFQMCLFAAGQARIRLHHLHFLRNLPACTHCLLCLHFVHIYILLSEKKQCNCDSRKNNKLVVSGVHAVLLKAVKWHNILIIFIIQKILSSMKSILVYVHPIWSACNFLSSDVWELNVLPSLIPVSRTYVTKNSTIPQNCVFQESY